MKCFWKHLSLLFFLVGCARYNYFGVSPPQTQLSDEWTPKWASLVSHWAFNLSLADFMGLNSGTSSGTISFRFPGKAGTHGVYLDGASYVNIANAQLPTLSALSISVWIKPEFSLGSSCVISNFVSGPQGWELCYSSSGLVYLSSNSGWPLYTSSGVIQSDTWQHIALRFTFSVGGAESSGKIFINGVNQTVGVATGTPVPSNPSTLRIGASADGGFHFQGEIEELGLWKAPLTDSEIQLIYHRQVN